jgi:hypothetical protein
VVYVEIDAGEWHTTARRSDGNVVVATTSFSSYNVDQVPPLRAAESYVEISAFWYSSAARLGPTSTYVSFAPGCAGSMRASRLIPRDTPRIGETLRVRLLDLPQSTAVLAFGWQRLPPVSLAPFGLPNCFQHISLDAAVFLQGSNNHAVFELRIPNLAALVGTQFHHQAVIFDPTGSSTGVVVSDAAEGIVGQR